MLIAPSLAALSLATLAGALQSDAPQARERAETHVVLRGAPGGHARLDRNEDGVVSREEFVAPLADAFSRLDKDGDGRLSREELAAPSSGGPGEVMIFDGGAAPDGDGVHRFTLRRSGEGAEGEPRVVVAPRARGDRLAEELVAHVARGSGEVVVLRGGGEDGARRFTLRRPGGAEGAPGEPRVIVLPDGPGAARFMAHGADAPDLDKDGDGRVSEEEFLTRFRDAFRRMDKDGSGHLEAGERENLQVHLFQHRREGGE